MSGPRPFPPEHWNIERLWSRPLARLSGLQHGDRIPPLAELRQSLAETARRNAERKAELGRSAEARQRWLAELAQGEEDRG
jgi:hypothetical protein